MPNQALHLTHPLPLASRMFPGSLRSLAAAERGRWGYSVTLLAALSHGTDFSVGCYCVEEACCHRWVLKELLAEQGAKLA